MKIRILVLLLILHNTAFGFEFEGGTIEIPQNFSGPVSGNIGNQGKVYAFRKLHGNSSGSTATLLQLSVIDLGEEFPKLTEAEMNTHSRNYLLQLLSGVERVRKNFVKGNPTQIKISGIPASKIMWSGILKGRKMEGIMYCYLYNSKIISLHTQDFFEFKGQYLAQAEKAFENIKINR